jgi:hypothetical protein
MRIMKAKMLIIMVVGWLLGAGTMLAFPTLTYQRQSIYSSSQRGAALTGPLQDGWYITRVDDLIYTLERPRFRIP